MCGRTPLPRWRRSGIACRRARCRPGCVANATWCRGCTRLEPACSGCRGGINICFLALQHCNYWMMSVALFDSQKAHWASRVAAAAPWCPRPHNDDVLRAAVRHVDRLPGQLQAGAAVSTGLPCDRCMAHAAVWPHRPAVTTQLVQLSRLHCPSEWRCVTAAHDEVLNQAPPRDVQRTFAEAAARQDKFLKKLPGMRMAGVVAGRARRSCSVSTFGGRRRHFRHLAAANSGP
jgi:hypothetical protein